jgi:hypothetical protein
MRSCCRLLRYIGEENTNSSPIFLSNYSAFFFGGGGGLPRQETQLKTHLAYNYGVALGKYTTKHFPSTRITTTNPI